MNDFDQKWAQIDSRMLIVPGKELFSALNGYLQKEYQISLNPLAVVDAFKRSEVWPELALLLNKIDKLRKDLPPES